MAAFASAALLILEAWHCSNSVRSCPEPSLELLRRHFSCSCYAPITLLTGCCCFAQICFFALTPLLCSKEIAGGRGASPQGAQQKTLRMQLNEKIFGWPESEQCGKTMDKSRLRLADISLPPTKPTNPLLTYHFISKLIN